MSTYFIDITVYNIFTPLSTLTRGIYDASHAIFLCHIETGKWRTTLNSLFLLLLLLFALPRLPLALRIGNVANLVFSLPVDGHEVVDDGVLGPGGRELEEDALLLLARVLRLVDVVPAVGLVVVRKAATLVLAELLQGLCLDQET